MCINRERSAESAFEMLAQARPYRDKIIGLGMDSYDPAEFDSGYLINLLIGVQEASGYSKGDLVRYMWNAFEGSWLSRSAKDVYIESLLKYAAAHDVIMS